MTVSPVQVQVAGLTPVYVGFLTGNGTTTAPGATPPLEFLGFSRDGVQPEELDFKIDVPGDQHGGSEGPPVEVQDLGAVVRVRLELTKYDPAVAAKVEARKSGATAGRPTSGDLMFAGSKGLWLVLASANSPRTYPLGIVRGAMSIGRGVKYSTFVLEVECHKDEYTGFLYFNSASGITTTSTTSTTTTTTTTTAAP